MKKLLYLIFIVILLFLVGIVLNIFYISDPNIINKYNAIIQGANTIIATILVILTLSTLYATSKQLHNSVRPYVTPSYVMLLDDHRNELDFEVENIGSDSAFEVHLKIINKRDKKVFYEKQYPKIESKTSGIAEPLNQIVVALQQLGEKGSVYPVTRYLDPQIYEEINLAQHYKNYYDIEFRIEYKDVYRKKYRNTFVYIYDEEEREYFLKHEKCIEL